MLFVRLVRVGKPPHNSLRQNIQKRRIARDGVDAVLSLAHDLGLGELGLGQYNGGWRSHMKPFSAMRDAMQAAL